MKDFLRGVLNSFNSVSDLGTSPFDVDYLVDMIIEAIGDVGDVSSLKTLLRILLSGDLSSIYWRPRENIEPSLR